MGINTKKKFCACSRKIISTNAELINLSRNELVNALERIDNIADCALLIISAFKNGNKLLIAGNGGSAADAQHFAAELTCTFEDKKRKALPAYALNTNTSVLTAWANDFSFAGIFERQIEALGKKGDILFSITTSGNSENIINAMKKAKENGMRNILLSGKKGGGAARFADFSIIIASESTPRIQECHIFAIHSICKIIDGAFQNE